MIDKLRILPVLIVAATLLSGLKLGDVWRGVSAALAAEGAEPPASASPPASPSQEPEAGASADAAPTTDAGASAETAAPEAPRARAISFSESELEVLQSLAERRDLLEARAKEQEVRENVLKATEKRIDGKIEQLKQLEARIQGLIRKRDEEVERQLRSLVKVYENMKPKDAARIFEQLEMGILLDVAERMREQKIAPILADMDPMKAKELTVELATHQNLPTTGG